MASKKLPKVRPVRSKPALMPTEDSYETRDVPSMQGGAFNKLPSDPMHRKKRAQKKKAPGGSPVGGNNSSNAAGAYPGV